MKSLSDSKSEYISLSKLQNELCHYLTMKQQMEITWQGIGMLFPN